MKILKLTLLSITILITAYLINLGFIKDPHIRWQYKLSSLLLTNFPFCKDDKTFNMQFVNFVVGIFYPDPKTTDEKYLNGLLIEEVELKSKFNGGKFKIKVYIPENKKNERMPVIVNIHGGGFVNKFGIERSPDMAREGLIVTSIYYRLAPENIFPTAIEDCYEVLEWIYENTTNSKEKKKVINFNLFDIDKISIIGESAGGNLAAVLPYLVRDRKLPLKIFKQILIYPTMNIKKETESIRRLKSIAYVLSNAVKDCTIKNYISDDKNYESPLANPLKNTDFSNIPPALIILATEDVLYSEGRLYADTLKQNGVTVDLKEYQTVHGFYCLFNLGKEDKEVYDYIINYLEEK